MMGIGVFANDLNPTYVEIMKDLADTQQLFLIIASTDYIYGTNYQFCHGYIGRDLANLSQEKCIQALGRIGRNKLQFNYSVRFRDNNLLKKLFFDDPYKPEAVNINKLFKLSS
jgi:predicted nuclease with TOPRIM domain